MKILFLVWIALFSASSFAEELPVVSGFVNPAICAHGEGNSRQEFKNLVVADFPEMHTRVIYSVRGVIPQGAKGLVYIYAGTSGNVSSEYGIQRSLAPYANELHKRGYAVLAFQPPIYHLADTPLERLPYLTRYSELENNLDWLLKTIEFGQGQLEKAGLDPKRTEQFAVMRSTFAAVGLEAIHRWAKGDEEYAPMGDIRRALVMGLDGHQPHQIEEWHKAEVDFFIKKNPQKGDAPVVMAGPKIFKDMTHQTEAVPSANGRPLPEVTFSLGSRDEFVKGKVEELVVPIQDFITRHPDTAATIAFHDGHHDPGREVRNSANQKIAQPMSRMKLILNDLFRPLEERSSKNRLLYLPDEDSVLEPLDEEVIEACQERLKALVQ